MQIKSFTPYGSLRVPSSKSYSHRYLIAAFIVNQPITMTNVNLCDDVQTTIHALETLGAKIEIDGTTVKFIKREKVTGDIVIDARESGTTFRMLFPLACYMYSNVKFYGSKSLMSRPFDAYKDILDKQKIPFEKTEEYVIVHGQLKLDDFTINGNISSQFASGLMFLNAFALSKKKITIIPPIPSRSYIIMTLNVLEEFGFLFESKYDTHRYIGRCNRERDTFDVEVDYSLLANFAVLAALKGTIKLYCSNDSSLQGDSIIIDFLSRIGVSIRFDSDSITVSKHKLLPFDLDLSDCIDLGPTMFVLAAFIPGTSHFSGVKRLQYKESNRLQVMTKILNEIGIETKNEENDLYIYGQEKISGNYTFDSCNDHRIAMALAILSMAIDGQITITDAEAINKSYPNFYKDLLSLQ